MKPCEYYIELLSAGLDGMLSEEQELELAEHLANCPACRELGPQLVAAHAAFTQMEELEAPEGFAEGVMARVRAEEKAKPKVVPFFRRPAVKSLGALAACAVLCVGLLRSGGMEKMDSAATAAAAPSASSPAASIPAEAPAASAPAAAAPDTAVVADLENATQYYSKGGPAESAAQEARSGEVAPAETALGEAEEYPFANEQRIRITWTDRGNSACILGSADSLREFLASFAEDDLTAVADAYGEDFFAGHCLLAVVVEEGSGSVAHEIAALYRDSVTILRRVPEAGTCDMAAWLILAEVDAAFDDGDVLNVHLE